MKTKAFYTFIFLIMIGMVIHVLASQPVKVKDEKRVTDNVITTPPPFLPWQVHIIISIGDCEAAYCSFELTIEQATDDCEGYSIPFDHQTITGAGDYYFDVPGTQNCVIVRIKDITSGGCQYSFSTNYCCECRGNNQVCKLQICP
jgi:hypothetical protein